MEQQEDECYLMYYIVVIFYTSLIIQIVGKDYFVFDHVSNTTIMKALTLLLTSEQPSPGVDCFHKYLFLYDANIHEFNGEH